MMGKFCLAIFVQLHVEGVFSVNEMTKNASETANN